MKKLTFFFLCFFSIVFAQENYQAKLVIEQIYWQNDNEWAANFLSPCNQFNLCHLCAILYPYTYTYTYAYT